MRDLGPLTQERRKQKIVLRGSDSTKPGTEVNYRDVHAQGSGEGSRGRVVSVASPRGSVNQMTQ